MILGRDKTHDVPCQHGLSVRQGFVASVVIRTIAFLARRRRGSPSPSLVYPPPLGHFLHLLPPRPRQSTAGGSVYSVVLTVNILGGGDRPNVFQAETHEALLEPET